MELYPDFLECGYLPDLFWSSSINEIISMINAVRKHDEERNRDRIKGLIGILDIFGTNLLKKINSALSEKQNARDSMIFMYEELFSEEIAKLNEQIAAQELAEYRARRINAALSHNYKKGGENSGRGSG